MQRLLALILSTLVSSAAGAAASAPSGALVLILPHSLTLPNASKGSPQATRNLPLQEGDRPAAGRVSIPFGHFSDILVALTSNAPERLAVPTSIIIPAGSLSADFPISLPDDDLVSGQTKATVTASAATFLGGQDSPLISDNDPGSLAFIAPPVLHAGDDAGNLCTLRLSTPASPTQQRHHPAQRRQQRQRYDLYQQL